MVVRMRTTSLLSQTLALCFSDVKHTRLKLILSSSSIFAIEYTQLHVCFYSISILDKFHKEANLMSFIAYTEEERSGVIIGQQRLTPEIAQNISRYLEAHGRLQCLQLV